MYPLVNTPHREEYDTFDELRNAFERLPEGLDQAQSWFLYDEQDKDWGKWLGDREVDAREFSLAILMPRKTAFTIWTTHSFERAAVQAWLDDYVRARTLRWYGWPET